jgi:ATP phosphoribosyltransferase
MIKVALPNKGVLLEPTLEILSACGYKISKSLKSLSSLDVSNGVEFFFLRAGDIPVYVANGQLDAGITGKDLVRERAVEPKWLMDLDYGHSKVCLAVPEADTVHKENKDFKKLKIATAFPNIVKSTLGVDAANIVELEGAVEISIKLGIAEAIADIVETGTTLRQAGLKVVGTPLLESCTALFAHPGRESAPEVLVLKSRLQGKLVARAYMMVEYDAPQAILEKACELTPGIESPTVTPLKKTGWFSVKAMIEKKKANPVMDELSKLGCKGILLTAIESARI